MPWDSGKSSRQTPMTDKCRAPPTEGRTDQHECKHGNLGNGHGGRCWQAGLAGKEACWDKRC